MRTEDLARSLSSVLIVFAIVLSMTLSVTFTAPPVLADAVISYPGHPSQPHNIFDVPPGQTFTLRHRLAWNESGVSGYYLVALYWDYIDPLGNPDNAWHFTLVSAVAYFDNDGDNLPDLGVAPIDSTVNTLDNGTRYSIVVANATADSRDGEFNVDITLRASGPDGTPHSPTDNHLIKYTILQSLESIPPSAAVPAPVTVRVIIAPIYPSKPTLYLPADGSITNDNTPYFEWTLGMNADDHRLLVDNDPDFSSPEIDITILVPGNTFTPTTALLDENYSWKVVAQNAVGENHSDIWTFIIDTTLPPPPPPPPIEGVYYNSRDNYYRSPLGESISFWGITADVVSPNDNVTFRIRVLKGVTSVKIWIWRPEIWHRSNDSFENMTKVAEDNVYEWWEHTLSAPGYETIAYYIFRIEGLPDPYLNGENIYFYADDENRDGGVGRIYDDFDNAFSHGYLLLYKYPEVPPTALGVKISIWPWVQSGVPGATLTYTVTVTNIGTMDDNYTLTVKDTAGWDPVIEPTSLAVVAGASENATLTVIIPENVGPHMRWEDVHWENIHDEWDGCHWENIHDNKWDNMDWEDISVVDIIKVTATSQTDNAVRDSATAVAHATPTKFYLRNLYEIDLDINLWLENDWKLVLKFYTWAGEYEGEIIIGDFEISIPFIYLENIRHPGNKPVENAMLVFTDNEGNVISTIASFTMHRSNLMGRLVDIYIKHWPFVSFAERSTWMSEIVDLYMKWPYAPF